MVVGAVLCLGLAVLIGGSGLWALSRPRAADVTGQVLRMVVPVQLAAAVMLAAAGVVALVAPALGPAALAAGAAGAVGTIAAGSWRGARYAARRESGGGCGSGGGCAGCTRRICG